MCADKVLTSFFSCYTYRSQTRSRSPVIPKSTPQKSENTTRKAILSPPRSTRRSRQLRTPSPGRRTPSRQSAISSSGTSPNSSRKAPKKVTPIKIVRFEDDQYSVVKFRAKKRRRDQPDSETGHSKTKRKRTDRYSIVEATPMKIRLRRSGRKAISGGSKFAKTSIGRSP